VASLVLRPTARGGTANRVAWMAFGLPEAASGIASCSLRACSADLRPISNQDGARPPCSAAAPLQMAAFGLRMVRQSRCGKTSTLLCPTSLRRGVPCNLKSTFGTSTVAVAPSMQTHPETTVWNRRASRKSLMASRSHISNRQRLSGGDPCQRRPTIRSISSRVKLIPT
jgi:hypothetical protein